MARAAGTRTGGPGLAFWLGLALLVIVADQFTKTLILGGAIGNLIDRLRIGQVVDFVLFHWRGWSYPAFNVADSAITIGAVLLIVDSFRQRRAGDPAP